MRPIFIKDSDSQETPSLCLTIPSSNLTNHCGNQKAWQYHHDNQIYHHLKREPSGLKGALYFLSCQCWTTKQHDTKLCKSTTWNQRLNKLQFRKRNKFTHVPGVKRQRRRRGGCFIKTNICLACILFRQWGERMAASVAPEAEGLSAQWLVSAGGSCWAGWRSNLFVLGDKGKQWASVNAI